MTRVVHVQKVSGVSGSEMHLLSLLPGLRARGYDVEMVVLHEGEPGAREFVGLLRAKDVPVTPLRMRSDVAPAAFARLAAHVRGADIVHTHLVHADLYALVGGALARVPVRVSTKHGFNEFREHRAFAAADRATARLAHAQIAISRGLADYLAATEGFDARAFRVIPYGIDSGPEPAAAPEEPRLLCVGRLIPIKGHRTLLDAFALARRELPALTLEIAGEGPLADDLRAAAPEGVRFLGRVNPIGPAIERSLAVVLPSLGEGFGMAALEAMERGRAVVASRVGGLQDLVVDGETGLLVPPGDAASLARALVSVAADPQRARAQGAAGRARALAEFSVQRCLDRTVSLYEELLQRA